MLALLWGLSFAHLTLGHTLGKGFTPLTLGNTEAWSVSPDASNHVTRYNSLFQPEIQFPHLYPKDFGSSHLPSPLHTSDTRVTTESVHLELPVTGAAHPSGTRDSRFCVCCFFGIKKPPPPPNKANMSSEATHGKRRQKHPALVGWENYRCGHMLTILQLLVQLADCSMSSSFCFWAFPCLFEQEPKERRGEGHTLHGFAGAWTLSWTAQPQSSSHLNWVQCAWFSQSRLFPRRFHPTTFLRPPHIPHTP